MKWAYDLCGAEPIIRDEVAYDAATIAYGEMVMLVASGDFTVGTGQANGVNTAYNSTDPAAHAVDALGVSQETKTTADSPSIATATDTTAEPCYVKTIINPFAVYRAECVTSEERAITTWVGTNLAITGSASVDNWMAWVYFSATAGPNFGELRLVVDTPAANTLNVVAPAATATTADKAIFIPAKTGYSNGLDTTAVGVTAQSSGTLGISGGTNLRVVESWMDADTGLTPLAQHLHYDFTAKKAAGTKSAKFYNDIMMKDHAYGVQE